MSSDTSNNQEDKATYYYVTYVGSPGGTATVYGALCIRCSNGMFIPKEVQRHIDNINNNQYSSVITNWKQLTKEEYETNGKA